MHWSVGLDRWIIEDGNYSDFRVGETGEFALEFYSTNLARSNRRERSAKRIWGSEYDVTAEVVFVSEEVQVIDFGVLAYRSQHPPSQVNLSTGEFVNAKIYLGLDPYDYFEFHHEIPNIRKPPLVAAKCWSETTNEEAWKRS